jgi:purine-nucleoside phosphorylase
MIIDSFDDKTNAKINPNLNKKRFECEACIITFSNILEKYIKRKYNPVIIDYIHTVNGDIPIYLIVINRHQFAFYKSILGAPGAVACLEDSREIIDTNKYICFGGSGCLNKEIARGKIVVPTEAYRDEGTSYHYIGPDDYIRMKNSKKVAKFFEEKNLPFVLGKTWTIDSFYRETEGNIELRKNDGCISVEMEASALQSVCDFREVDLYYFLSSGDLLDSPEWDSRVKNKDDYTGTQHDKRLVDLAFEIAMYLQKD